MNLIIKIAIVRFVGRVWKIALNDNESHYLNGFTIAAFAKFSANGALHFVITNLIILIIPIFFAFVKKKTRKMVINDIYAINYTHIFRVCQEKSNFFAIFRFRQRCRALFFDINEQFASVQRLHWTIVAMDNGCERGNLRF